MASRFPPAVASAASSAASAVRVLGYEFQDVELDLGATRCALFGLRYGRGRFRPLSEAHFDSYCGKPFDRQVGFERW